MSADPASRGRRQPALHAGFAVLLLASVAWPSAARPQEPPRSDLAAAAHAQEPSPPAARTRAAPRRSRRPPSRGAAPAPAAQPEPASPPQPPAAIALPAAVLGAAAAASPAAPAAPPSVAPPPPAAATVAEPPPPPAPAALPPAPAFHRLTFPAGTGAAALARGETLLLVFDAARALDAEALRRLAPGFASLHVETGRGLTELHIPLAAADRAGLRLVASASGWALATGSAAQGTAEIGTRLPDDASDGSHLLLQARGPGRVVTLRDPTSDGLLLVGTLTGEGGALRRPPATPGHGFEVLPTLLGVALRPEQPDVLLRTQPDGFSVVLLRASAVAQPAQAALPALLDLADADQAALLERRRAGLVAAGAVPPLARGVPRLAVAEALLGLGLGVEALSLAQLAVEEDPRLAGVPRVLLLLGAGPLIAGRAAEAQAALADPRLDNEPEALLWRALAQAAAVDSGDGAAPPAAQAAGPIADALGNLQRYPLALRARLVPLAAEALVEAGRIDHAARLLQDQGLLGRPRFALAQARLMQAQERTEAALAAYAMLSRSRDPAARSRALERAAELRLAAGRDDAGRAATGLRAAYMAWRGDGRELALRLRAAALHRQAGQHAAAIELLEETAALFPEEAARIVPLLRDAVLPALADPAQPLEELARLAERQAEAIAPGAAAVTALTGLAERALAAQQPRPAIAAQRLAAGRAADPAESARLRLRLARMLLDSEQPEAARDALRDVPATLLPPEQRPPRARLEAEILRRTGDAEGAAALLRGLGPDALPELSELLATQEDWAGAAAALAEHVAQAIPSGPAALDLPQQQLLLRLAALASLAGDKPRLAAIRQLHGARLAAGPLAESFSALLAEGDTAAPPGRPTQRRELEQVREQLQAARRLQEELRSLR